jgi:hypothetical protein
MALDKKEEKNAIYMVRPSYDILKNYQERSDTKDVKMANVFKIGKTENYFDRLTKHKVTDGDGMVYCFYHLNDTAVVDVIEQQLKNYFKEIFRHLPPPTGKTTTNSEYFQGDPEKAKKEILKLINRYTNSQILNPNAITKETVLQSKIFINNTDIKLTNYKNLNIFALDPKNSLDDIILYMLGCIHFDKKYNKFYTYFDTEWVEQKCLPITNHDKTHIHLSNEINDYKILDLATLYDICKTHQQFDKYLTENRKQNIDYKFVTHPDFEFKSTTDKFVNYVSCGMISFLTEIVNYNPQVWARIKLHTMISYLNDNSPDKLKIHKDEFIEIFSNYINVPYVSPNLVSEILKKINLDFTARVTIKKTTKNGLDYSINVIKQNLPKL